MGLLEIGRIVRPHGLRGEVVVALVTNRTERLDPDCRLAATRPDGSGPGELRVIESRPHQHRYLVRFEGVEDRESAEALRDVVLSAEALEDPEAYFVHELVGCQVVERSGEARGEVVAVEANPASDLLLLADGTLVPLRFVVERRAGELVVEVPEGLFG